MSPAPSSTFRCCEMAGCVIANGFANCVTVASPLARRARMARRVGSARAVKAASRLSIRISLYKHILIVKRKNRRALRSRGLELCRRFYEMGWRYVYVGLFETTAALGLTDPTRTVFLLRMPF